MGTGQGSAWKGGLAAFGVIAGAAIVYLAVTAQPEGEAVTESAQADTSSGPTADVVPRPAAETAPTPAKEAVTVATEDSEPFEFTPEKPYKIIDREAGVVDKGTYMGFKFYHEACHVCHGPGGLGSSFAPALKESLKTLTYDDYVNTVINGRENIKTGTASVMPSFGDDPNVMGHLDDIYAYLKARADGAMPPQRPTFPGHKTVR